MTCKSPHSSGPDKLASLPVTDRELAAAVLTQLPPWTERSLLALERRSSLAGTALTATMTSPQQISTKQKMQQHTGFEHCIPANSPTATSTLEAREPPCDRGVSPHCLLFLNSTCGVTDLGHSFRSFIQGAFKGKYALQ